MRLDRIPTFLDGDPDMVVAMVSLGDVPRRFQPSVRRETSKLNIIPLSVCSAIWQCAIDSISL